MSNHSDQQGSFDQSIDSRNGSLNREGGSLWERIFPAADHRWMMGLRPGDPIEFFRPRDPSGQILLERQNWLQDSPQDYIAYSEGLIAPLRETIELALATGVEVPAGELPASQLLTLGGGWESDFAWMVPSEKAWILAGGVVCFPSSWSMPEKVGRPLREIHLPVPRLNTELERQIDTFLDRMQPGRAWVRENAGFSRDQDRNHLPSRSRRRLDSTVKLHEISLRIEHQLLFKLPQSGAILFGIRVEIVPLEQVIQAPGMVARMRRFLSTISADAAMYKGLNDARDAILGQLP